MNEAMLLNASEWAIGTDGRVELGDPRRTDRAMQMASAMAVEPAASLPLQMGNANALQAAYRFLGNEAVSHAALQEPHWLHTRELAGQRQRVLLIQDTTNLNYSQHPKTSGLGPIGHGKRGQGFFLQTVVAVDPQTQEVLGLAYQEPFVRQPAPKRETRAIGPANRRSGNEPFKRLERPRSRGNGSMWEIATVTSSPSGNSVSRSSVRLWCALPRIVVYRLAPSRAERRQRYNVSLT